MKNPYIVTSLIAAVAMVAPAADMGETVKTPADLLERIKNVEHISKEDARALLADMPVPEEGSMPFINLVKVAKCLALWAESFEGNADEKARIEKTIEELSPGLMYTLLFMKLKLSSPDEEAANMEKWEQFRARHQELGLCSKISPAYSELKDYPQDKKEEIVQFILDSDLPDSMASAAYMYAFGAHGVQQDIEKAMYKALRAVIVEKMRFHRMNEISDNVGKSVAKSASSLGEVGLPLKMAALRWVYHYAEDDEDKGVAAYLLSHSYRDFKHLQNIFSEVEYAMQVLAIKKQHPAAAYELGNSMLFADFEQAQYLFALAEEWGYKQDKDLPE